MLRHFADPRRAGNSLAPEQKGVGIVLRDRDFPDAREAPEYQLRHGAADAGAAIFARDEELGDRMVAGKAGHQAPVQERKAGETPIDAQDQRLALRLAPIA